ncbi:Mth938-like domain-containing protein [Luedemannella flava]|uniref:Mth938-like domain-containing protein n=1 Tax=Luedemannella flava TaxID=349316 RepID=UPI0031E172FD
MEGSPNVLSLAWGAMDVEGVGQGKDFKLWPGGGRAWDWRETGTQHDPGVQVADVEELIANGATTVVLSQGMDGVLQVGPQVVKELEDRGVTVHVARTREAVEIYNGLVGDTAVGGLFHSTC